MAIKCRCDHCDRNLPDSGIVEAMSNDGDTEHFCDVECFGNRCVENNGASYSNVTLVTIREAVHHWLEEEGLG